jgi:hypothetical protein
MSKKIPFFRNGFKGIDTGLNPAKLPDGYSPDSVNWLPVDSKYGVHGIRKGSKPYGYYSGNAIRHMHSWVTRQGVLRDAVINNLINTGARETTGLTWELIESACSFSFGNPDANLINFDGATQHWKGCEAYEATYPPTYDEDYPDHATALFTTTGLYGTFGSASTPLSDYSWFKFVVDDFYGCATLGYTQFGFDYGVTGASVQHVPLGYAEITAPASPPDYITAEIEARVQISTDQQSLRFFPWIVPENTIDSGTWWDVSLIDAQVTVYGLVE